MPNNSTTPKASAIFELGVAAAEPLDRARAALLSLAAPVARPLLRDRGLRIAVLSGAAVTAAFVVAWRWPMTLLALGPVALGVPHLLSDVRYLVARPAFHERAAFWLCVAAPLAVVYARPELWVGLIAAIGAALMARATVARRLVAALALSAGAAFAHAHRGVAEIWMAHAHNLIALGMWCAFFGAGPAGGARGAAKKSGRIVIVTLFISLAALLFLLPTPEAHDFAGLTLADQSRVLSPFREPAIAARFVLFFAFAQSVHYAVWLRAVPDEARARPGVRSFASSLRALGGDVGAPVLALFVAGFVAVAGYALADLAAARTGYLRLALAHGYLEIAVATLFVLERTRVPRR